MPRATRKTKAEPLNARRRLLISMYLREPTASMADLVKRAGICRDSTSSDSAQSVASRILKEPAVIAEIQRRRDVLLRRENLTLERHLDELAKIGHSDMADFASVLEAQDPLAAFRDLPNDMTAAVKAIRVRETADGGRVMEIVLWDKNDALRALAGHMGMRRALGFLTPHGDMMGGTGEVAGERMATLRSMLAQLEPDEVAFLKRIAEKLQRLKAPKLLEGAGADDSDGGEEGEDR